MTDNAKAILERLDHQINDILYDLVAENEDLEEQIEKNKGEWIPVSQRLPEDGTWNLFTDGKSISVERYKMDVIDHFFPNGRWFEFKDVIAWQPLPEPYKAEKPETCKGCLEPCIMYEPDMRACKKKVKAESEDKK